MRRFEGRTVLVTGARSGIGAATVRRPVEAGASVLAGDIRAEDLDRLVAELDGHVHGALVDITDRRQVDRFVAAGVARYGVVHGLVNAAGIRGIGTILDTEAEALHRVLAVNPEVTFAMCQAFARVIAAAGGQARGIRANAIAPGMIRTPMTEALFQDRRRQGRSSRTTGSGASAGRRRSRPRPPLCFPTTHFITGVVLTVDGGKTVSSPARRGGGSSSAVT